MPGMVRAASTHKGGCRSSGRGWGEVLGVGHFPGTGLRREFGELPPGGGGAGLARSHPKQG